MQTFFMIELSLQIEGTHSMYKQKLRGQIVSRASKNEEEKTLLPFYI